MSSIDHPIPTLGARPSWHWRLLAYSMVPILGIMLGQLATWFWIGELASHWTMHGVIALLPVMVIFRRDPRWGRLFLILLLIGSWPWLVSSFASRATLTSSVGSLKIATANVRAENSQRQAMHATLLALPVDVLVLQEVSLEEQQAFKSAGAWPHQEWHLDDYPFSLAILSRHRLVTSALHRFNGIPMLDLLIDGGEAPLRLFVVHPWSPMNDDRVKQRNNYLALLGQKIRGYSEPVVVAGDWNLSPGSPIWPLITDFAQLKLAPGAQPATWPAMLGPLGIPIDHIMGRNLGLAPLQAFTIPGSDHRGLMTTITLPETWGQPQPEH
jgi:endonuclease/exonuclease/phosphatase (EEP) superfamily protein YafD